MIRRGVLTALLVVPLALGACGDDDGDAVAADGPERTEAFCGAVERYYDSTGTVDSSSVAGVVEGLRNLAQRQREAADVAPAEVEEPHARLADAGEELHARLVERNPQTVEELDRAIDELTAQLTEEYGDLEAETQQVEDFAEQECGLVPDD